jgi:hypothetical protein
MRRFLLGSLFVSFAFAASSTVGGCSSNTPATANAYVLSQLTASDDLGSEACGITSDTWVEVGTSSSPADDGSSATGYTVSVSCSVTANSDGSFQVNALATDVGFGSVGIVGKFTTSGTQMDIHGSFQRADTGTFATGLCTVDYTDADMGVAAGRVWGVMTCPDAVDVTTSEIGPDGGNVNRTCAATATFKFQNCGQ